mmetsp:Transcript_73056/g.184990  ORF Transcript_73056/g.184990 Transcript_73056/m.184990 type:complete len:206 (+) Transcript_73056:81-698(+)
MMSPSSQVLALLCCVCVRVARAEGSFSPSPSTPALRGAAGGRGPVGQAVPAWCQYVPEDFQGVACRGSSQGCSCSSWCSSTPAVSQPWNPECCGCDTGNQTAPLPNVSDLPPAGEGNSSVPLWCRYVPEDSQAVACQGGNTSCACAPWCSSTPLGSQLWNPECCTCNAVDQGTTPPPASPAAAPMPEWCQFVPVQFQGVACRASS